MAKHPRKKLTRSVKDRKVAGVCAGIAEYFNIDPVFIRLIFLIFLLPGGVPGVLLYLLCWFLIPNPSIRQPYFKNTTYRDAAEKDYTETYDI